MICFTGAGPVPPYVLYDCMTERGSSTESRTEGVTYRKTGRPMTHKHTHSLCSLCSCPVPTACSRFSPSSDFHSVLVQVCEARLPVREVLSSSRQLSNQRSHHMVRLAEWHLMLGNQVVGQLGGGGEALLRKLSKARKVQTSGRHQRANLHTEETSETAGAVE
jgi:hypothetical protein